ncbi:DNA glycosylase [Panus rudis PR-1116 ss-1]|nr:DNA glycosylase [Panus rudis PR-1116 ss-1]
MYQPKASGSRKKPSQKQKVVQRRNTGRKQAKTDVTHPASEAEPDPEDVQTWPHSTTTHVLSDVEPIRTSLLQWYDGVHENRGMPWRKPYDPELNANERSQRAYEVWISEIMLQQTQVATVIPYYNRWMSKFPTIKDLADSDIDTVNSLWKGLGYYSRAARLLTGAQKVVRELGGRLPDNVKDMETKIPGVGRYSAGAICSIAYNQCVPVLDGNVHRLLSRVLALHAPPKAKQSLDILWSAAEAMVQGTNRPGDLNQALIELGSTICKVRDPSCESCPINTRCWAYKLENSVGKASEASRSIRDNEVRDIEDLCTLCEPLPVPPLATSFPMKVDRKKAREELDIVNVVEWRSKSLGDRWFLLVKRPNGGLLAGLHEFPTVADVPRTISAAAVREIPQKVLHNVLAHPPPPESQRQPTSYERSIKRTSIVPGDSHGDLRVVQVKPAGDVIHIFSHIRKTYRVQWVVLEGGGDKPPSLAQFTSASGLDTCGASTKSNTASKGKSKKPKGKLPDGGQAMDIPVEARWVTMDEVQNANVGTGVLKVWNQVCTLWARRTTT